MMRALVVAGIIAAGVMGAISFGSASPTFAGASSNTMTVDLDTGTAGIQSTRTVASGATVDIDIVAESVNVAWEGYAWELEWDNARLNFVSNTENTAGFGGAPLCATAGVIDETAGPAGPGVPPAGKEWAGQGAGCLRTSGTTTFSGTLVTVQVQCQADGTTPVHLVDETEDPSFWATFQGSGGFVISTLYNDALLTCGVASATNTPTATNTPIATSTPVPAATSTPCTGASCNLPPAFTRTTTPTSTVTPGGPTTPVPGGTTAPPPPPGPGAPNPTATRTGGGAGVIGGPDTGSGPGGDGGSALMLSLLASGAGLALVAAGGWKLRGRTMRNR